MCQKKNQSTELGEWCIFSHLDHLSSSSSCFVSHSKADLGSCCCRSNENSIQYFFLFPFTFPWSQSHSLSHRYRERCRESSRQFYSSLFSLFSSLLSFALKSFQSRKQLIGFSWQIEYGIPDSHQIHLSHALSHTLKFRKQKHSFHRSWSDFIHARFPNDQKHEPIRKS